MAADRSRAPATVAWVPWISGALHRTALWAVDPLCPSRLVAGGWAWRRDSVRGRFRRRKLCGDKASGAPCGGAAAAARAPCAIGGAASADHTHRESGRQRASACCICAGTTAPGPSRYLAATHRQRRHLHSTLRVSTRAAKVCWGAGAHCGWVEGRERDARESSVEGLACSKK